MIRTKNLALFILSWALSASSLAQDQQQGPTMAEMQRKWQTERQQSRHNAREADLVKWRALLDEYHKGKRDDQDGAAILFNILTDFGLLHSTGTVEEIALTKEYQTLQKKHPEFLRDVPMKTHDQIEAQEQAKKKAKETAEVATNFVPQDQTPVKCYQHGQNAAVVYQYRIEFFHLKQDESLRHVHLKSGVKVAEPPYKVMTFQQTINTAPGNWYSYEGQFMLVCTNPMRDYLARTENEEALMGGRRGVAWRNSAGELHDLCGAIDLETAKISPIPTEWNPPVFTLPLGMLQDGTQGLLGVGEYTASTTGDQADENESGDGQGSHFAYRYLIRWAQPDKVEKIEIKNLSDHEFNDLADRFRAMLPSRKKFPSYYEAH